MKLLVVDEDMNTAIISSQIFNNDLLDVVNANLVANETPKELNNTINCFLEMDNEKSKSLEDKKLLSNKKLKSEFDNFLNETFKLHDRTGLAKSVYTSSEYAYFYDYPTYIKEFKKFSKNPKKYIEREKNNGIEL